LRFSEATGLISAITFPRRVIWMDRFVVPTCSTGAEQFALIGKAPDEHLVAEF